MKTKKFLVLALLTILTLVVSACAAAPTAGAPGAARTARRTIDETESDASRGRRHELAARVCQPRSPPDGQRH